MDERARVPVASPIPNPTPSYWQNPPSPLATHTSGALPPKTDTLIIGSGITGAAIAHFLQSSASPPDLTMLEARTVTSGATGRNGGHTKAASYRSFLHHASALGTEQACLIARLELATIRAVHAFAAAHLKDTESRPCQTVDAIYDPEQWEAAKVAVDAMRKAMPDEDASRYEFYDVEEMRDRFHVEGEGLCGGVGYEAGSISAYRFTTGVLEMCVAKGMRLFTETPALSIKRDDTEDDYQWKVETPRGMIASRRVILATNGYTASLQPQFQGAIVPLRGQVTAHRPGSNMPRDSLPSTYSFIYAGGFEYMIPKPSGTVHAGDIVIGGGLARLPDEGLEEYGVVNDAQLNPAVSSYLRETTPRYFGASWGEDGPGGRVRAEWTGIMGFTPDGFPFVGRVPGEDGLWVCAGFQGHGMVMCWTCAKALAAMIDGRDDRDIDGWFPRAFRSTPERLAERFKGSPKHTTATADRAG
ncbi:FAD dependent oxidoreductase [Colletotrichum karsti]|uniref:FAD dependent oxidoreductase n=1 Tax=Colletotrichum karsti TaxID=1095194 RepID=A0A9P6LDS2_9PEZI|nr:FAD dependent oxidoreductase [Colletotrichum karsti]KAF9869191.1 FAD dependent oxidoreductase [Colletotrichum karsti]